MKRKRCNRNAARRVIASTDDAVLSELTLDEAITVIKFLRAQLATASDEHGIKPKTKGKS